MNIHPQNAASFEAIFPSLLSTDSLFCHMQVKNNSKKRQFVPDLELLSEDEYKDKLSAHDASELAPFVVDWANQLVAVDDEGLDRIMHHYYTSGMEKGSPGGPICEEKLANMQKTGYSAPAQAAAMLCAVHPHVAEFADLF